MMLRAVTAAIALASAPTAFAAPGYSEENICYTDVADLAVAAVAACTLLLDGVREADRSNVLTQRGIQQRRSGDIGAALADFDEAIRLRPKNPEAHLNRASAHLARNDYARAMADYDRAIELQPAEARYWYNRGLAQSRRGEPDKALADYAEALRLDPAMLEAQRNRAQLLARRGDGAELDRLIETRPRDGALLRARGDLAGQRHDWPQAISDYMRAAALAPPDHELVERLVYARTRGNDRTGAIADATAGVAQWPSSARMLALRGSIYAESRRFADAIADFDGAIRLEPRNPAWLVMRGRARLGMERTDLAIADYDAAIRLDPNLAEAHRARAWALVRNREHDKALVSFERAIELDPRNAEGYVGRAGALATTGGETARALADLDKAVALEPQNAFALQTRGGLHLSEKRFAQAQADLDAAAALRPDDDIVQGARCRVRLLAGVEFDVARRACDMALRLSGDDELHRFTRGLLGLKQGAFADAYADFDAAVRAQPSRADYLHGRGLAAIGMGRATEGQADLARAKQLNPNVERTFAEYNLAPVR